MIHFHPVDYDGEISRDNPLFVGNFYDLTGMWWQTRKARQAIILSIAVGWFYTTKRHRKAPGFIEDEILITALTSKVKDAKDVLVKFFDIKRIGFNFNNGTKSPTLVSPKKLRKNMVDAIEEIVNHVSFAPGLEPLLQKNVVVSTVKVRQRSFHAIKERLQSINRHDLIPPVMWLMKHETVKFYYAPSGKLQARDTSVWPVRGIEAWPGWLRKELFGTVIDIENAYCQFLVSKLYEKYEGDESKLEMLYPDILRADRDKVNFRNELCTQIFRLPITSDNISYVKKLIMALANGSNASEKMMISGTRSEAIALVLAANPDLPPSDFPAIGKRLGRIAKQFKTARKDMCQHLFGDRPTAANQKRVFHAYFEWEREQRYKIWEQTGKTGLMMHDGIDGVVTDMDDETLAYHIARTTSVRVSVDSLLEFAA